MALLVQTVVLCIINSSMSLNRHFNEIYHLNIDISMKTFSVFFSLILRDIFERCVRDI